ncbi:hypothetical protein Btru_034068 [Bulinus truncatus]|nr:hypothetical protein Btru_034068 [Bulinus truncatus]
MPTQAVLLLISFVYSLIKGPYSQKIVNFKGYVGNRSCTQPYVAREFLDKFYIQAELDPAGADLSDWWTFALVSPRGFTEELVAAMKLDECKDMTQPNLDNVKGSEIICWKKGPHMNVLFAIEVNPGHNGSYFRGVWSNMNSGSVQTPKPDIKLTTVDPEEEMLNINGRILSYDAPTLPFAMGGTAYIKYCMYNVDDHELSIKFQDKVVKSGEDCAMLNVTIRDADIGKRVTVGIRETAGRCMRVFYRDFVIEEGMLGIDKDTWRRSTNGSTQTFIKSLGILLMLAWLCTKCIFILG